MPSRKTGGAAPAEIFISYAHQDRAAAETICAALESAGLQCWIAPRNVAPGVPYAAMLVEAISAARIVLVVFSHAANRSDGVLNEIELAFNRKRPIFTVRAEDSEPKGQAEFYLRRGHWFDAFADVAERLQALPDAVRAALSAAGKRVASAVRNVAQVLSPRPAGNLTIPQIRLFGRDADAAQVVALLGSSRAVTLWGSGGVGKTQLALAAAARVEAPKGGVWFVDLAPVRDGASVAVAVASVLGIREERHRALLATVTDALARRDALVVLDNCEHLIEACAMLVDQTLRSGSKARFLCTSREPLAIAGETVFRVEPLALPEGAHDLSESPAIQLFLERAASAGGRAPDGADDLAAIATIVRRLDGIPFAIELAAARSRSMPPAQIARALDDRLQLLAGGNRTGVARQQTLRGTIDWSYQLLGDAERFVLPQLSVFAGGWTLDALTHVVRGHDLSEWDVLDAGRTLTEKSMVSMESRGDRYRLLEMTREYADALLTADERGELARSHAEYYRDLAMRTLETVRGLGNEAPFEALRAERANLRAAIEWSLLPDGDAALAAAICGALATFWDYDGTQIEGIRLLERAVDAHKAEQPTREAASAWYGLAFLRMMMSVKEGAFDAARRAASLASAVGDSGLEARSLMLIGPLDNELDRTDANRDAVDRALGIFRELGDLRNVAAALSAQAFVAWRSGDFERGRQLYDECVEIARTIGVPYMMVVAQLHRAELEFAARNVPKAVAIGREALAQARETHKQALILHALLNVAAYLLETDASREATAPAREALDACALEESVFGWRAIQLLGVLAAEDGHREQGRRFLAASSAGFRALGYHPSETEKRVQDRLVEAAGNGGGMVSPVPYATIAREAQTLMPTGFTKMDREGLQKPPLLEPELRET
jgi:predicted ATPase